MMATSKEYLQFILDRLSGLDDITYRSMMGEYMIYDRGKLAAYLCDDRLLVKIMPCTVAMLPNAEREAPYDGAKAMLSVKNTDDREFLQKLFRTMYSELPPPKPKMKK